MSLYRASGGINGGTLVKSGNSEKSPLYTADKAGLYLIYGADASTTSASGLALKTTGTVVLNGDVTDTKVLTSYHARGIAMIVRLGVGDTISYAGDANHNYMYYMLYKLD